MRRFRDGEAAIDAYAEDYAYLVWGLLELFQADGDPEWLEWALALQARQDERFWDEAEGGWFSTTGEDASVLLRMKEDYDGAEPLMRAGLEMNRKLLGPEHPEIADFLSILAVLFIDKGDYAGAELAFREALEMRRNLLGAEHPDVAKSLSNLAGLLQAKGNFAAAEPLYRDSLAMRHKLLGAEHPDVAIGLNNLASLLHAKGDYAGAEPLRVGIAAGGRVGVENPMQPALSVDHHVRI